jgi:alkane 1-monooxygenase
MQLSSLKYLSGYTIPLVVLISFFYPETLAFAGPVYGFVVIPLLEYLLPKREMNLSNEVEKEMQKESIYDYYLYLAVPIQLGILFTFLHLVSTYSYSNFQLLGMTLGVGICSGVLGINVAHELGHRVSSFERWLARILLCSTLYTHFYIEHNHGHHRYVATPEDPASARYGESIYAFLVRTIYGSYVSAWRIQVFLLKRSGNAFFSIHNEMLLYQTAQILLLGFIGFLFGWFAMGLFVAASFVGICLLEIINYIEHYGLLRKEIKPGMYEKVQPWHSWNSDYVLGRIMLFELTRHSDHHYKASRKYQVLRHFESSPQMPFGYPGMMVIAMLPPLWFWIMNPLVKKTNNPVELPKESTGVLS